MQYRTVHQVLQQFDKQIVLKTVILQSTKHCTSS